MSTEISFSTEYRYKEHADGITIMITLSYGETSIHTQAKVDTGAEVCIFSNEIGMNLGIPNEQGIPRRFSSLGGVVEAFGHEVMIQTGEMAFQSLVYFAKYPGLPRNLLGRQGWLRNLKLAVIDYDNLLYLNAYDV
ncbi:MAG TPA: hypothetical protein VFZ34_07180 [Blastocatellia bacterium]|nr:hypothetical protein [Blastocatellia bacterium]